MNILLLSNSTNPGQGFLSHARNEVLQLLGGADRVLFVPFALADHDAYTAKAADAFGELGVTVTGLHTEADPRSAIDSAPAVFVGGGNTFRLLDTLYRLELLDRLRDRVRDGMPYLGASAGTNIAAPTIRTTNDMPIVEPPSFASLGLIPFQINPHYLDPGPERTHMGETREERLLQFHEVNATPVLGLREGTWLRVKEGSAQVGGTATNGKLPARLFLQGDAPSDITGDVTSLLHGR
ncbi:dipeptidase PepE [Paramicrobacterium sp. CJ85]|uniref:dipeptidase PepE n=1 Tax=Paramicrobacterium sp. CJ85 TaxID=3445355 RepID=UPI003F62D489